MRSVMMAFFLIGCAGATGQVGPWGIRQCGQQFYVYSSDLDPAQLEQVHAAFDYWNKALGKKVWIDGGVLEGAEASEAWTVVRFPGSLKPKSSNRTCGRTTFDVMPDGCMVKTVIRMSQACERDSTVAAFQGMVRHEIGHALGLYPYDDHSDDQRDLMYDVLPDYGDEPRKASAFELDAVKELY